MAIRFSGTSLSVALRARTSGGLWAKLCSSRASGGLKPGAAALLAAVLWSLFLLGSVRTASAGATPGPWVPLFKGVDHAVGTNNPSIAGNFPRLQVVHCIRVDLTDPDVELFTTPRASSYVAESRETLTRSVPNFLKMYQLQVACDANFYAANPGGSDPSSEGISCEVHGLQVCTGAVVSAVTYADAGGDPRYASLLITTNNQPVFRFRNTPPGTNTTGIYTAVTGYYPVVSNGFNVGAAAITAYPDSFIHQVQPRTTFGVSQDGRYLLLVTIDGRQGGYSDGALDVETGYWMLQFGAWNAISMDGGGSTAMYMADSTGNPVAVNHSSYLAGYGRERYIGSHLGVYAKPLPGFFNDIQVLPNDTTATVTWTTVDPATTQVQYGVTTNFGSSTTFDSTLVTNHAALLTGLAPNTGYYYQIQAKIGTSQWLSSNLFFVTTNYVTTNLIFDLTNQWAFSCDNLDGINWQAPDYDDSGWFPPGPGVLWTDRSGSPNTAIPDANTEMPVNPNTTYPYTTYYFRTHFVCSNPPPALLFTVYLDDGAIFYLNGTEVQRAWMDPYPAPIYNSTLAKGYTCSSGNATCPYFFMISGDLMTNLVAGTNLLAAEVHNYSAGSPDITFGAMMYSTNAFSANPQLSMVLSNGVAALSWSQGGYTLQQASSPDGPWLDAPGPIVSSPFTTPIAGAARFYRLRK